MIIFDLKNFYFGEDKDNGDIVYPFSPIKLD